MKNNITIIILKCALFFAATSAAKYYIKLAIEYEEALK